jgi:hypothetical protein
MLMEPDMELVQKPATGAGRFRTKLGSVRPLGKEN